MNLKIEAWDIVDGERVPVEGVPPADSVYVLELRRVDTGEVVFYEWQHPWKPLRGRTAEEEFEENLERFFGIIKDAMVAWTEREPQGSPSTIIVNGKSRHIRPGHAVSHADIVKLAGLPPSDYYTITYMGPKRGDSQRSGSLIAGHTVSPEDGTIFSCAMTGNA